MLAAAGSFRAASRRNCRLYATESLRHFDPKKILPSGFRQVRIINNTVRDGQQSNLSAEMDDEHRQQVGKLINDCYKDMKGPPGYEQIWGGTIPMFDIWKRGVQPFESLRRMSATMPNTPASALIRSNALNAMANQPKDVVEAFIAAAKYSGIDVFTNFCAHNDWRNHVAVAEAVHKAGGHYQAAISWAVYTPDPTIYNVQWAVDLFRELVKLGAHSLYLKDPSGVLTPEMAGVLAAQIKEAFPDLPLVFHTHYQTGYGYMTYLKAMENGANGVECSLGLADGAAQPFGLTMLRTVEDLGFDTGKPNKAAMQKLTDEAHKLRALYPQGRVVRVPDIRVEEVGIAGGQRTILDKELKDAGQAHLAGKIDELVQAVRDEGGKVCQVTPVADAYAREAMRRLRGGDPNKSFTPGYAAILTGEGGLVKEPVDPSKQKQALTERALAHVLALQQAGKFDIALAKHISTEVIPVLRRQMDELAAPAMIRTRIHEVETRISQLERISKKPDLLEALDRKIKLAATKDKHGKLVIDTAHRIKLLREELQDLNSSLSSLKNVTDEEYEALLREKGSLAQYAAILDGNPELKKIVDDGKIHDSDMRSLIVNSGFITCCAAELLAPGLDTAKEEIIALDKENMIGLTLDDERIFKEATILQATYRKTAVPGMVTNFFKNYRENPGYWAPLYDKPAVSKKVAKADKQMYKRGAHVRAASIVGKELFGKLISTAKELAHDKNRLENLDKKWIPAGKVGIPTKDAVAANVKNLQQKFDALKKDALNRLTAYVTERPGSLTLRVPSASTEQPGVVAYRQLPLPDQLHQAEMLLTEAIKLET